MDHLSHLFDQTEFKTFKDPQKTPEIIPLFVMPINKNSMSELAVYTFLRMISAHIDYSSNPMTYVIILITNSTNKM